MTHSLVLHVNRCPAADSSQHRPLIQQGIVWYVRTQCWESCLLGDCAGHSNMPACCTFLPPFLMQLSDACSNAEEQQGQVSAARQEVIAVLAGREQRCQELRAEVSH